MKVYLDDERVAPEGWVQTKSAQETIDAIVRGDVTDLSLDHDLGDPKVVGTGYDVLTWIEERIALLNDAAFVPKNISLHTANPSARIKMELALKSIQRRIDKISYEQT
jgi:hypothetical protein